MTPPPAEQSAAAAGPGAAVADDEGTLTRINLRLSDQLKGRIESAPPPAAWCR